MRNSIRTTSGNRKSGFVVTNKFTVPNETKPRVTIEWEDNSNNKNKNNDVKSCCKNNNGKIVKKVM